MKKLLSLLLIICICITALPAFAETEVEFNPLRYEEYMYEEIIFISGSSDQHITLGLYYPEEYGGSAKYVMTYSPTEFREGIELPIGEKSNLWPEGLWKIVIQCGDVSETFEFTLCEEVDRTVVDKDDDKDSGSSGNTTVVSIIPDETELTLKEGKTVKVNISTTAKSLSVEVEDEDVVSASYSDNVLTVTALKKGDSQIWVKSGSNYASINVTVTKSSTGGGGGGGGSSSSKDEKPTELVTEPATEEATEPATEEATEPATEEATEPATEEETEPVNPFEDIENHWAKESILSLYKKGVINGMDENTFAPDDNVTRAQFVTMLYKAFNLTKSTTASPFNDVDEDDWYYTAVMAAFDNRITTGDTAGNFNPTSLVTRQDMAVFSHRALVLIGKDTPFTPGISPFADHSEIKDYAVEAVYSMKQAGIINGMTSTTFEPLGNATRAQAAHIIAKLLEL